MTAITDSISGIFADVNVESIVFLLIKITILLALVLLMYRFSVRRSASFRHSVLGVGLVFTPVLVLCHFAFPFWSLPLPEFAQMDRQAVAADRQIGSLVNEQRGDEFPVPGANSESDAGSAASPENFDCANDFDNDVGSVSETTVADLNCESPTPAFGETALVSTPSVTTILVTGWALVAGWLLARLAIAWLWIGERVRNAKFVSAQELRKNGVPESLVARLLTQNIRVKISRSRGQMPMGAGLFRKTILVPGGCRQWSPFEWRSVLLHEQAHFNRGDCWLNLAARVQHAVLWFHPLSSILIRMIRDESEFACDDRVIESGLSKLEYADVLLQVASRGRYDRSAFLASVTMSDSVPLESRMKSILNNTTPRQRVSARSLMFLAGMICLVIGPVATAQLFSGSPARSEETDTPARRPGDYVQAQDFAEEDAVFNVTLKPGKEDTTYAGEFAGTTEDTLRVKTEDGEIEIEMSNVSMIYCDPRMGAFGPRGTFVKMTDGKIIHGSPDFSGAVILNETLDFTLCGDQLDSAGMSRSVSPNEIFLLTRIVQAELRAQTVTEGVAASKLSYHLRAPANFDETRNWPAIVLLHENGQNSRSYIDQVVETWPGIADRYVLIGINGEFPAGDFISHQTHPRFKYTGLSFVGKGSNFRGFQGTDRESPAPIAEAITELRERFDFDKIFVAGHGTEGYTAGGNNAYHIQTHFPEVCDGVIVLAGASLVQCNVEEFVDDGIRKLQRETPLVIVDGEPEGSGRGYAEWAYKTYLNTSFPMLRYLQNGAGSKFTEMPFDQAVTWLEQMTVKDPEEAIDFAESLMDEGRVRDAIVLMNRVADTQLDPATQQRADAILRSVDEGAEPAEHFLECLKNDSGKEWVEEFLEFRKTYEFAASAKECMAAFDQLRTEQDVAARSVMKEAQKLDADEKPPSESSEKYQEIIDKYYASTYFMRAKSVLDARAKKQIETNR